MEGCLFCRIVNGEIPAQEVYRDDQVVAFKDISPKAPIHILIVPTEHIASLAEAEKRHRELLGEMLLRLATVAQKQGIAKTGYRVVINTRHHSGQEVDHLHFHLLGGRPLGQMNSQ